MFNETMIDTLVMPDERRDLIKALAQPYQQNNKGGIISPLTPWTADFVKGKGEGKIFLLHGKPGVGKTYTAGTRGILYIEKRATSAKLKTECIAEYTKRPLLSLTISDIGVDAQVAELNLERHFKRAKLWDAILLIDEADIYMERRETQDLSRNSLVSGEHHFSCS